jgi:flagellar motor switch protein FliN/FliY
MSDILSQEQIDALLNAQGFSDGEGGGGVASDPEVVYQALLRTFDLFCEQAGTVISTVLNKHTTYQTMLCEQASGSSIREKQPSVLLQLKIPFTAGVEGAFSILIQKTDAATLSDLMMMGDGTAEYTEDHKDAIGELFNQVTGAFTNTLTSEWATTVTAGTIEVTEFDLDHPPVSLDNCEMVLVSQKLEQHEETFITVLVPHDLSGQLAAKTKPATGGAADGGDDVSLNMSELDDLSKVTSFESPSGGEFREQRMSTGLMSGGSQNIDMLLDIDLDVSIELGKSVLSIKRILDLAPGSIVELDRMAGEPVDLMVNNKVVAKGEVVVIDENFGIRIVSLVSPEERIRSLR